eukprot:227064-Rhodomonas_salina.1
MSRNEIGYAATRDEQKRGHVEGQGDGAREVSAYALATQCPVLSSRMVLPAYAVATRCPVLIYWSVRGCYAMSGTDLRYGATRRGAELAGRM